MRRLKRHLRPYVAHMPRRRNGTGRPRLPAFKKHRVRHPAYMPYLRKDSAARLMHRRHDLLPQLRLRPRPQPRHLRIADAHGRDRCAFRNDQAGRRALTVVLDLQRRGQIVHSSPQPCKRCHDDAIGQVQRSNVDRIKKVRQAELQREGVATSVEMPQPNQRFSCREGAFTVCCAPAFLFVVPASGSRACGRLLASNRPSRFRRSLQSLRTAVPRWPAA